jgi:hypothetical protein
LYTISNTTAIYKTYKFRLTKRSMPY